MCHWQLEQRKLSALNIQNVCCGARVVLPKSATKFYFVTDSQNINWTNAMLLQVSLPAANERVTEIRTMCAGK